MINFSSLAKSLLGMHCQNTFCALQLRISMDSFMLAIYPALHHFPPSITGQLFEHLGREMGFEKSIRHRCHPIQDRYPFLLLPMKTNKGNPFQQECGRIIFLIFMFVWSDTMIDFIMHFLAWTSAPSLDIPLAPSRRHLRSIHWVTLRQQARKTPVMLPTRGLNC